MREAGESARPSIGVMGGTFDPIHIGHLVAASEVLHAFDLDRVLFMPAGDPWQRKAEASGEDRLMMTTLAVTGHAGFAVSRLELDRKGPTYTADSFELLREFHGPETTLYLIAGADTVLNLSTWKKLDRLKELIDVIAVTRPGSDLEHFVQGPELPRVHTHEMPGIDVSATDIRDRVRTGLPIDFLVPIEVARYIRQNGLYANGRQERSA